MDEQNQHRLATFASLHWYDEVIRFVFNFVTKTSELLLAAGVVISTANFLTDGDVMGHNKALSDAWSWAQAIAIDSSLGIVFLNAFQAIREREKVKAIIFFTLTALLATVAGLVTHFDALAHAAGLPVTDKGVSGVIPLWVMTTLRSIAVIGFLLSSRLKQISFSQIRKEWKRESAEIQEPHQESTIPQIDYQALANALVGAMQQSGAIKRVQVVEEGATALPPPQGDGATGATTGNQEKKPEHPAEVLLKEPVEQKLTQAYESLRREREDQQNPKPISARDLAKHANIRRSTCSAWLLQQGINDREALK